MGDDLFGSIVGHIAEEPAAFFFRFGFFCLKGGVFLSGFAPRRFGFGAGFIAVFLADFQCLFGGSVIRFFRRRRVRERTADGAGAVFFQLFGKDPCLMIQKRAVHLAVDFFGFLKNLSSVGVCFLRCETAAALFLAAADLIAETVQLFSAFFRLFFFLFQSEEPCIAGFQAFVFLFEFPQFLFGGGEVCFAVGFDLFIGFQLISGRQGLAAEFFVFVVEGQAALRQRDLFLQFRAERFLFRFIPIGFFAFFLGFFVFFEVEAGFEQFGFDLRSSSRRFDIGGDRFFFRADHFPLFTVRFLFLAVFFQQCFQQREHFFGGEGFFLGFEDFPEKGVFLFPEDHLNILKDAVLFQRPFFVQRFGFVAEFLLEPFVTMGMKDLTEDLFPLFGGG